VKALVGIVIVALHLAGFAWLAEHARGHELVVDISNVTFDGGPGLVRKHWRAEYRGGFVREVGATALVGPFQDKPGPSPSKPACTGRVVIGEHFLVDQLQPLMQTTVDAQLRGLDIFPVGKYRRIDKLTLAWAKGGVHAAARVVFEHVIVPVTVDLVPKVTDKLAFEIKAHADLDFDNRVLDWISNKVGADKIASQIARDQIKDVLVTTFAPPPPFDLGGGQQLQFTYCDGPLEIVDGAYGALPFGVAFTEHAGLRPPKFAVSKRPAPLSSTTLAIDLDVDALNAMLFELWRTGWLDQRLADVGLDRRFNEDPTVTEYLDIRISPVKLALAPVVSPTTNGLRLAADARTLIGSTVGRVYGALSFTLETMQPSVDLDDVELSCERTPTLLVPCYSDLVGAMRGRGGEFHGALTSAFTQILADIFVDRHLGASGLPAELVITGVTPNITGGSLHLELAAKLAPPP
jgi:hypothetical protein